MGIRGSGGGGPVVLQFLPQSFTTPPTNGAPLALLDGTNVDDFVRVFGNTAQEFASGKFRVPDNLSAGDITFQAVVMAKTAVANKNVEHRFGHVAIADGEDFDVAYSDVDSGDKAIDGTQDNISVHTWTAAASSLGWSAGDLVLFRYSRNNTGVTDNLAGEMYLLQFSIKFPG